MNNLKSLVDVLNRNREAYERMEQSIISGKLAAAEVTATYTTPDGGVTLEVGGDMRLRKIEINAEMYETYDADLLGDLVVSGLGQARRMVKRLQADAFHDQFKSQGGNDND